MFQGLVTVNGKQVIQANIEASNGVIHIVDAVIYPLPTGNIAEIVTGDSRFSTLLAAVIAAGKHKGCWVGWQEIEIKEKRPGRLFE